ncbi:MAG: hypothetical protein ACI4PQ_02185, partial [Butyricicoccaceae bacterium]
MQPFGDSLVAYKQSDFSQQFASNFLQPFFYRIQHVNHRPKFSFYGILLSPSQDKIVHICTSQVGYINN